MAWLFKGSEYIRYNNNSGVGQVDVGPTPIAAAWRGWPESFAGVDCAISGVGADSDVIYFFYGEEFISYDLADDKVVTSPKPIQTQSGRRSARSYAGHSSSRSSRFSSRRISAISSRDRCRATRSVWYKTANRPIR